VHRRASLERQVDRAEDLATQVHDGAAELRLAEVEPDEVPTVGSDAQQDRGLAPRDRPRPTSSIRPSSMSVPTRSLTDVASDR
jgi:hypothetical protein